MELLAKYIPNFLFILLRAGIVISMLPLVGSKNFPTKFKAGFVLAVALVLTPVVQFNVSRTTIPILVMREVVFGIALGLAARFIFFAFDIAGEIMSSTMGISIASVFNPDIGQSTEIARLYGIIATLALFVTNAHRDLIYIFVKSYEWVPAGGMEIKDLGAEAISIAGKMFVLGLKISAPVVIIMLAVNILLGFVYKAAPQMNVFFVGYPVYIFIGFVVILFCMPIFINAMGGYFDDVKNEMARVIAVSRP